MANDFETRLERLEAAQGIGIPQILVLMPGEDEAAKVAAYRRDRGLNDHHPVGVLKVVFVEWPLS
jgi:hypothetical protein